MGEFSVQDVKWISKMPIRNLKPRPAIVNSSPLTEQQAKSVLKELVSKGCSPQVSDVIGHRIEVDAGEFKKAFPHIGLEPAEETVRGF